MEHDQDFTFGPRGRYVAPEPQRWGRFWLRMAIPVTLGVVLGIYLKGIL